MCFCKSLELQELRNVTHLGHRSKFTFFGRIGDTVNSQTGVSHCNSSKIVSGQTLRGSWYVLIDFSGISPVSNETCTIVAIMDTLQLLGETESGSAGTQPDKGYPGLRCANGASDPYRLMLPGVVSWMPLDIGAMPQKIPTRTSLQETTYVYVR